MEVSKRYLEKEYSWALIKIGYAIKSPQGLAWDCGEIGLDPLIKGSQGPNFNTWKFPHDILRKNKPGLFKFGMVIYQLEE